MTIRPIRILGDPVLRAPCRQVTEFDEGLAALVEDLMDTVSVPGRAGLAAPQIGVSLAVFAYRVEGVEGYVVNPVLGAVEGDQDGDEGCLSIPGLWASTPRAMRATVSGLDVAGKPVDIGGSGLIARCLQHETDHLLGRLFIDRLDRERRKEAMRAIRNRNLAESTGRPSDTTDGPGGGWLRRP